jgi:glycosyltransferase involved in cell wall biosynthesis
MLLHVNTYVPPDRVGGAERCAEGLALALEQIGRPGVLFGMNTGEAAGADPAVRRLRFPRPYYLPGRPRGLTEHALWHVADTLHPTNARLFRKVLNEIAPSAVIVHNVFGIGFNIFQELEHLPTIHVLHDLGLVCLNRSRYKNDQTCKSQCFPCNAATFVKRQILKPRANLALVSPSRANLAEIERYWPPEGFRTAVIPNVVDYPVRARVRKRPARIRLLYVGRISQEKGVEFALRLFLSFHAKNPASELVLLGDGPELPALTQRYGGAPGVHFKGQVSLDCVADHMAEADALLVPSLWQENLPGVVVHAMRSGLPVLATAHGGLPELVRDYETGRLLPANDEAAWLEALNYVLDTDTWRRLRANAKNEGKKHEPAKAAAAYLKLLMELGLEHDSSPRRPEVRPGTGPHEMTM